jgi:hypothetical protein
MGSLQEALMVFARRCPPEALRVSQIQQLNSTRYTGNLRRCPATQVPGVHIWVDETSKWPKQQKAS